jgi:predicted oxidoreductase
VHQFETLQSRLDQPLVTNQIEFSLLRMDPMFDGTLDQCQRLRISPMAWSPLAGGRLFRDDDEAAARVRACCAELSPKYGGASVDVLALAWLLAHPSRPTAVLGTNQVERVASAVRATEIRLEREDWYALWTAAQGRRIP